MTHVGSQRHRKKSYVSSMYERKKVEKYLRVNLLGLGPRLMKKEFTRPRSHRG